MAQLAEGLPLAQVMIPESWDRVPHWVPCSAGSLVLLILLSLPTPFTCALSLPFSQIINLRERERERARAHRGRERSRLPAEQGAPLPAGSQDSGIMT